MKRSDIVGLHRIKNKPSRNAFDLSHRHMFTAQIGELLPIFNTWVNPGDTLKLGYNGFSRTAPLQTAAFTRLKENVQYYFVPFQSLWKYFEQVVNNLPEGQNGQNISKFASSFDKPQELGTSLPYISLNDINSVVAELLYSTRNKIFDCYNLLKNQGKDVTDINLYIDYLSSLSDIKIMVFGVFRYTLVCKLLNYLGYGNFPLMNYDMLSSFISYINSKPSSVTASDFINSSFGYVQPSSSLEGSPNLSILPLLAYHKIINDHYRYQQWQSYEPWTCNIDFITPSSSMDITALAQLKYLSYGLSTTLFDIEFSNLSLDYFTGVLPRAQYGDESAVALDGTSLSSITLSNPEMYTSETVTLGSNPHPLSIKAESVGAIGPQTSGKLVVNSNGDHTISALRGSSHVSLDSSLKISALRSAIALQKYKEVQNSNDSDFASQVLAHFGIKPKSDIRMSKFIGGSDSIIDINPQINQNLAGNNEAQIKAIATGDLSAGCKFTADTYGIVIGIYRCVPQLDLAHVGVDRQLFKTDASDFVIPELDSIGMQTQYRIEVASTPVGYPRSSSYSSGSSSNMQSYGFAPRYCEYKTSFDRVDGAFNSVLSSWVTGYDSKLLFDWATGDGQISQLLACRPSICYPIFQEQISLCTANDKIFVGSVNTCVAIRNLSVHGLPYTK
jgi:hypothetical protein